MTADLQVIQQRTLIGYEAVCRRTSDVILFICFLYSAYLCLKNPQYFVPDDGLFYYQIAFNAAHGLGLSFAEGIQTNGFQHLWMLVCYIIACFVSTKIQLLHAIVLICVLLNGLTILLLRNFISVYLADRAPSMAILLLLPIFCLLEPAWRGI